ncbi:response regulator [Oceaniserpentilla sp. 4NH20-0058]|uniref:response regulator n=1 Tax=Oceaniserpentilla sp. 4NH20-0058 TaxID=3127660 RepID=UPI0031036C81
MASILAVDDSEAIRTLMKVVLEADGHTVFVKENGREALDFAKNHTVDLVITDLNMPEMGGMSLVSHLRRLEPYKSKPILVITTETADYKKKKAKGVGATGWIAKPVDKDRLLAAVHRTVG